MNHTTEEKLCAIIRIDQLQGKCILEIMCIDFSRIKIWYEQNHYFCLQTESLLCSVLQNKIWKFTDFWLYLIFDSTYIALHVLIQIMTTIIYVTIIDILYKTRNPETRTRYLRRLLIKIKIIIRLRTMWLSLHFFWLGRRADGWGKGQHDRRRQRAMQLLMTKFKTKPKLCEFGYFYWLPKISKTTIFWRCST